MKKITIILGQIFVMLMFSPIHGKQLRRSGVTSTPAMPIREVLSEVKKIEIPSELATDSVDKNRIIQKLDALLLLPLASMSDEIINDLFDLAAVDREMARAFFKKIIENILSSVKPLEIIVEKPIVISGEDTPITPVVKPVMQPVIKPGDEPMKQAAGRPAPPRKFGVPANQPAETVVSGDEPMKIASKTGAPSGGPRRPGAPSGGPAKKLGVPSGATKKPGVAPVVAPKAVQQVFSQQKLNALEDDKLVELLDMLLEKLPSNWNGQVVEKVEEKTKYGSKIYNVYGAPIAQWSNDISTLKKVIIAKGIMSQEAITKTIADRIGQVRSEKNSKPALSVVQEEKPKEELTEQDLVRLIRGLLADPKKDQIGWVVSVKGNIKALDKINHEAALEYHNQFITLTGERPFLK